jgi:RND superfamily putative drug exporter
MFVVLFGLSMDYHVFVTSRCGKRDAGLDARLPFDSGVVSAGVDERRSRHGRGVRGVRTLSVLEPQATRGAGCRAAGCDGRRGVLLPGLALLGDRAHQGPAWLPRLHH